MKPIKTHSRRCSRYSQFMRAFQIMGLLSSRAMTARELSQHFRVNRRTIYRDLATIEELGIPVYVANDDGGDDEVYSRQWRIDRSWLRRLTT